MIDILEEYRDRDSVVTLEKNSLEPFCKFRVKIVRIKTFSTEAQARKEYFTLAKPKREGAKS